MIPNSLLRLKARTALKPVFPIALLACLIATFPTLLIQVAVTFTLNAMSPVLQDFILQTQGIMSQAAAELSLQKLGTSLWAAVYPSMLGWWITSVACFLLLPFLTVGFIHFTQKLIRGEAVSLTDVFARSRLFLKAIGLQIMVLLRVFLWGLPGMAVSVLASLFVRSAGMLSTLLTFGMLLSLVLELRALLHYALAEWVMAEQPDLGINACLRESLRIMRNRKLLLFSLMLFFYLLSILVSYVSSLFSGAAVLATMLSMALSLVITVYQYTTMSAFYLAYKNLPDFQTFRMQQMPVDGDSPAEPPEDEDKLN